MLRRGQVGEDGRLHYKDMLKVNQVHTELVVIDPTDSCVPPAPASCSTAQVGRCPGY